MGLLCLFILRLVYLANVESFNHRMGHVGSILRHTCSVSPLRETLTEVKAEANSPLINIASRVRDDLRNVAIIGK